MPTETIGDLLAPTYKGYLNNIHKDWTLCLGAGICKGILPDWAELTNKIVNRCFGYSWNATTFKKYVDLMGFSLDSWIQGGLNHHITKKGGTILTFNKILVEELYGELISKASTFGLRTSIIKLFESPKSLDLDQVFKICEFFESQYSDTTLMKIVNVLLEPENKVRLPQSIITFNVDSLLSSLLILIKLRNNSIGRPKLLFPKESFKKITKPYQTWGKHIPIFHLHGSISPYLKPKKHVSDSRDNLIFLESSYTKLAGSMFSWAQSNFLYLAQNNRLIFLGLSMSDPNIRRWLNWTSENYLLELRRKMGNDNILSLRHLWIDTKKQVKLQKFADVSLHHLGVKVGLISDWKFIGDAMKNIMSK